MKRYFWMDCHSVMDYMYESEKDDPLPLFTQIRMDLHFLLCPPCAAKLRNLRHLKEVMETDFLPASPEIEDLVMRRLYEEVSTDEAIDAPAGFSFRGWVIIGFFVLLSLSSSFFGMNFAGIAAAEGLSFLLPVGLTIGMVLTCYGALFIGSHLKELSGRFRLR